MFQYPTLVLKQSVGIDDSPITIIIANKILLFRIIITVAFSADFLLKE